MIGIPLRTGLFLVGFSMFPFAIGCKEPIKARFVVQPDLPFEIGTPVFVNGHKIGKVSNLAMDANDCYADVAFIDKLSRDRFSDLMLTSDGSQLVLVKPNLSARDPNEFRW